MLVGVSCRLGRSGGCFLRAASARAGPGATTGARSGLRSAATASTGATATAAAAHVGVANRKARSLQAIDEINLRADNPRQALLIDDNLDAKGLNGLIGLARVRLNGHPVSGLPIAVTLDEHAQRGTLGIPVP